MTINLILNIIFFITLYPVIFIMYFILRASTKEQKPYYFGLSRGKYWKEFNKTPLAPIEAKFRKELNIWFCICLVLPLVTLWIPYFSIGMTIWMLWLILAIFTSFLPYIRANKSVSGWKKEELNRYLLNHPDIEQSTKSITNYAELKAAGATRTLKPMLFVLPTVLSLLVLPVEFTLNKETDIFSMLLSVLTVAICTPIFFFVAWLMDKQKTIIICEDATTNINYSRARKKIWSDFWLLLCWINTIFTWAFYFCIVNYRKLPGGIYLLILVSVLFCIVTILIAVAYIKKYQKVNNHYKEQKQLAEDLDQYWIYGLFYCNPNDNHVTVEQRVGMGTTTNLATPIGKFTFIFAAAMLFLIPIMCVWVIMEEFTPIHLCVKDQVIVAEHLKESYHIPFEDIVSVSELSDLPDWSKVSGSSMEGLEKGTFEIYGEGKVYVFLNPKNSSFLKVDTQDKTYYLSGYDDGETQLILDQYTAWDINP